MDFEPIKYNWTQMYHGTGKFQNLYRIRMMLQGAKQVQDWDRLEPIEDLTQAQNILKKFTLNP